MAYVTFSNGVILQWDETLTVGTLIRTYYAGYWILERIEFRDAVKVPEDSEYPRAVQWSHDDMRQSPLFHFCQVLNDDGKPSKMNRKCCDASFCHRVDKIWTALQVAREHDLADSKAAAIASFL